VRQARRRRGVVVIARAALIALALVGLAETARFAWIQGKGWLGQSLMERAWVQADDAVPSPWPDARTRPAARLFVPELKLDRLVVEGMATPNLAWGPGLATGDRGHTVIAAHRDTHFSFLGRLVPGHHVELARPGGATQRWRVTGRRIVDSRVTELDMAAPGPLLTLVTCWPIDAAESGGPLRLVVSAVPAREDAS
jgi:sortase A